MDGMEKITARMRADAQSALDALEQETQRSCSAIRTDYEKRAAQERAVSHERSEHAAQERYERLCSAADMESRKLELSARQEILSEAYTLALDKLCSLPRERYEQLLLKLLSKAVGTGHEQVMLCAADREALGEAFVQRANEALHTHLTLASDTADIRAGFLLIGETSDVNGSFETLLALSREQTEREAARRLFS